MVGTVKRFLILTSVNLVVRTLKYFIYALISRIAQQDIELVTNYADF